MEITENKISAEEFCALRQLAGFRPYSVEDCKTAMEGSLCVLAARQDGKLVGTARLIGDGRTTYFIKDVIVHPEYQKQQAGKQLMEALLSVIRRSACDGAYVGLMSTPGKEAFYEKLGFIRRPTPEYGSGMVLFLENK